MTEATGSYTNKTMVNKWVGGAVNSGGHSSRTRSLSIACRRYP